MQGEIKGIMKRNAIILIIVIICTGIFASNYGGTIPYALFYFSLLVPLMSFIYILIVLNFFRFHQEAAKKTFVKGETVDYFFSLSNDSFILYSGIKVNFIHKKSYIIGVDEEKEYCLMPGEREAIYTKLCCKYRGQYFAGIEYFTVTDYLNLFNIKYEVTSQLPVTVLPRIVEWKDADVIEEDKDEKKVMFSQRQEERLDVQVRKYSNGDPMRHIHWKASARTGQLMTRMHYATLKMQVMILIDLSTVGSKEMEKILLEDAILEETLSVGNYCNKKKIPAFVCFDYYGYKKLSINTYNEWNEFYMLCGKIPFESKLNNHELCTESKIWIKDVSNVIIITNNLNTNLYNELKYGYKESDVCVLLVVNKWEDEDKSKMSLFIESGINVRVIMATEEK